MTGSWRRHAFIVFKISTSEANHPYALGCISCSETESENSDMADGEKQHGEC